MQGYFEDPTKSILVVFLWNVQRAEVHFRGMGVHVVTIIHHLGGFIGDPELKKDCLPKKVMMWMDSLEVLDRVARRHPQESYDGLHKSLQQE